MTLRRQKRVQSRLTTDLLVKSLVDNDEGWVVRSSGPGTNSIVEFVPTGDRREVQFTLTIKPGRGSCLLRFGCFETVELKTWTNSGSNSGAVTWLHPCDRCRLKKAVELFMVRYAHGLAAEHLK